MQRQVTATPGIHSTRSTTTTRETTRFGRGGGDELSEQSSNIAGRRKALRSSHIRLTTVFEHNRTYHVCMYVCMHTYILEQVETAKLILKLDC